MNVLSEAFSELEQKLLQGADTETLSELLEQESLRYSQKLSEEEETKLR